jgi:DNA-binding NarL/FixJ family response regulator
MVRTTLEEHAHFEVCAEAGNGAEAVELAKQVKPDVAILNIMMPVLNGFDAAREIRRQVPQSAIVILSTHADRLFIDEARKIGVRAYVAKSDVGEALVKAVVANRSNCELRGDRKGSRSERRNPPVRHLDLRCGGRRKTQLNHRSAQSRTTVDA